MRVDESIANCQVSAEEGYYLECDYQSAAYRCEKHQVPKVLVCIRTAIRYCGAWGKSRFMSPRAWALLNKTGFSFVCLIRSSWMRVGTSGQSWWFGWTSVRRQSSRLPRDRDSSIFSLNWHIVWYCLFQQAGHLWMPLIPLYQRHTSTACNEVSNDGLNTVGLPH